MTASQHRVALHHCPGNRVGAVLQRTGAKTGTNTCRQTCLFKPTGFNAAQTQHRAARSHGRWKQDTKWGEKTTKRKLSKVGRGSQGTRKLQEAAGSTAFQLTSPVFHKHSTQPCFTPWQCLGLLAGVFFPSDTCGLLKQRQRDTEEERSHSGPLFLKAVWTEGG